jgi:hypothetical protein
VPDQPYRNRDLPERDREGKVGARQAAEALFAAKPRISDQPDSDVEHQPGAARKPRVLRAMTPGPIHEEAVGAAIAGEGRAPLELPAGKAAQLGTLAKYGMTVTQLAELHGVPAETIRRLLRKS